MLEELAASVQSTRHAQAPTKQSPKKQQAPTTQRSTGHGPTPPAMMSGHDTRHLVRYAKKESWQERRAAYLKAKRAAARQAG